MIRLLSEADRDEAVALLAMSPYHNLYMLGNIATAGFDREFCQFWGDDADGTLRAVLNRYMQGWTLFGLATADWPALARTIDEHPDEAVRLQDNPGGIPSILPYLSRYHAAQVAVEQLMVLPAHAFRPQTAPAGVVVRRATLDDLPALVDLYRDAGSMSRSPAAVERPLRATRVWLAEADGVVTSAALTNAETSALAMVGGVFTPPEWRNRGMSQAVCSALCEELIAEGREPVLYWDTAAAGTVYRKLGFEPHGEWRSVRLASGAPK